MKFAFALVACGILATLGSTAGYVTKARRRGHESMSSNENVVESKSQDFGTLISPGDEVIANFLYNLKEDTEDSLLTAPLKFFYGGKKSNSSKKDGASNHGFQNTVAECTVTREQHGVTRSVIIYLSLKDAEDYGKRVERIKEQFDQDSKVEGAKLDNHGIDWKTFDVQCKSVIIEDEEMKCKACPYVEVLAPMKHERHGIIGQISVLGCINGYDSNLTVKGAERPYFIYSDEGYHPICFA